MYTHVGTAPRRQSQKKSFRGTKEMKGKEERGEANDKRMNGGKSQWKEEEHVQHSPLLHALSSHSLTSLDQPLSPSRPLPCTPAPGVAPARSSPLTPGAQHVSQADGCVRKPSNMAASGAKAASPQDLYVPMDPIYEGAHTHKSAPTKSPRGVALKQETTKSANDSKEMDVKR